MVLHSRNKVRSLVFRSTILQARTFADKNSRGVFLEEMDTRFGGANHVEQGGEIMGVEDAQHADLSSKMAQAEHRELS